MLRPRTSEQIRRDAIKMGVKKAREGCLSCMNGYFTLAREHGATQEEIEEALAQVNTEQHGIPRRELLKIAAIGGLAALTGGLAVGVAEYSTGQAGAASMWWGTDSNTQACCGMAQNFYIGRMGYGVQPQGDAFYFNINSARSAGNNNTYGYWGLVGPGYKGNYAPYDWGKKQANCAWNAWHHGPHANYIGGYTVFVDIELGFGGWRFGDYGVNQAILNGFLAELFNITPHYVWPGLYVSPLHWNNLFGQRFVPSTAFVLWITGSDTCGGNLCSPCNFGCNTPVSVANQFHRSTGGVVVGGHHPVLWQYWISSCGCGDYNVATQYARSFTPR